MRAILLGTTLLVSITCLTVVPVVQAQQPGDSRGNDIGYGYPGYGYSPDQDYIGLGGYAGYGLNYGYPSYGYGYGLSSGYPSYRNGFGLGYNYGTYGYGTYGLGYRYTSYGYSDYPIPAGLPSAGNSVPDR